MFNKNIIIIKIISAFFLTFFLLYLLIIYVNNNKTVDTETSITIGINIISINIPCPFFMLLFKRLISIRNKSKIIINTHIVIIINNFVLTFLLFLNYNKKQNILLLKL